MNTVAETILIAFGLIGTFFFGYSVGRQSVAKELATLMAAIANNKEEKKDDNEG